MQGQATSHAVRAAIVGTPSDPIVAGLADALARNERVEPVVIDPFRYPNENVFGLDPGARAGASACVGASADGAAPSPRPSPLGERETCFLTYNGEPLDDVGAFFVRQIVLPMPYFWRPSSGVDYRLFKGWYRQFEDAQGRFGFLVSLLVALAEEGRAVVNPIRYGWPPTLKTLQLRRLARAGIPIPRTLVTSSPDEAAAFLEDVRDAVVKPAQGGAGARRVTDEDRRRLALVRQAPAIFQERIEGEDLRVTLIDGEPVSCCRIRSSTLDYRLDPSYGRGENVYESLPECPADLLELSRKAARACDLIFTGIDVKRRGPRDYVILELNGSPGYAGIERWTGDPITATLARYLARRAREAAASLEAERGRTDVRGRPRTTAGAAATYPREDVPDACSGGDMIRFLDERPSFFEYVLPP